MGSGHQHEERPDAEWLDTRPKPRAEMFVLTPRGAVWSRRWRIAVGVYALLSAMPVGLYTAVNAVMYLGRMQAYESTGGRVPAATMAAFIALLGAFALAVVASIILGIWNIVTCYGTARGPLAAVIALSAGVLALLMFFVGDSQADAFHIVGYVLYGLPIVGSIGILGLDRFPADTEASDWEPR